MCEQRPRWMNTQPTEEERTSGTKVVKGLVSMWRGQKKERRRRALENWEKMQAEDPLSDLSDSEDEAAAASPADEESAEPEAINPDEKKKKKSLEESVGRPVADGFAKAITLLPLAHSCAAWQRVEKVPF